MGIRGSVTSAVSSTSVTLPANNLTIIGAGVYAATVGGYLQIAIDATRLANFLFSTPIAVTSLKNPVTQGSGPNANGIWPFTLQTKGNALNYVGVGLTSGSFVFYYGTPLPGSLPLNAFKSVVGTYTTGAIAAAFAFPGDIKLTGVAHVFAVDTVLTILQDRISFNTSAGFSVTVSFSLNDDVVIIPFDNIPAAQSLTVTNTLTGTGTLTAYIALYYAE